MAKTTPIELPAGFLDSEFKKSMGKLFPNTTKKLPSVNTFEDLEKVLRERINILLRDDKNKELVTKFLTGLSKKLSDQRVNLREQIDAFKIQYPSDAAAGIDTASMQKTKLKMEIGVIKHELEEVSELRAQGHHRPADTRKLDSRINKLNSEITQLDSSVKLIEAKERLPEVVKANASLEKTVQDFIQQVNPSPKAVVKSKPSTPDSPSSKPAPESRRPGNR